MTGSDDDRFLDEAVARGLLRREQADDARRLLAALGEVELALTLDEVLARRGHLSRERSAELRRALARQRVGRYEVIERLGEGGSGVVWKARDVVLDRMVALKLLSPEARDDPAWRERFLREARTAVTLNHAGLVRGLDCGEADGYLYFAMEYVPGETLAARLRREGRVPEKDALRIAADVVRVLRYVAGLGIVHRDLKPDNVVVTPDGRVKVCDLGLAKPTREEAERAGAPSSLAGTPLYVAPEQIRDGDRVDWRADVYSLGATLYHLLTGRPPFPWEKGRDLLQRHLTEVPASPREFAPDVSPGAAAVVLKMLQKSPADRYARFEDLEADLESVLAGRPPVHTASFASERRPAVDAAAARAAAHRRAAPVAVLGAAAFALAVVAVGATLVATTCLGTTVVTPPPAPPRQPLQPPPPGGAPSADLPPVAPPPAPVPDTPAEAEARRALDSARRLVREQPDDLAAHRDAFRFVAERHAGTTSAEVARGIVETLSREIEVAAAARFDAARADAARAETEGRLGDAIRLWEDAATRAAGTPRAGQASAEAQRLRTTADARLRDLLDAVRDGVAARAFDEARARLREAERVGLPWAEGEVAVRRRDLDAAESAWVAERAATRAAFDRTWGAAVLKSGEDGGVAAALAALDAASRTELAPWAREIDDLRIEILAAARAPAALPAAPTGLDLRSAYFRRLSRRELAEAESLLPRLAAAGVATGELRDGLARVRGALVASADEFLVLAEAARAAGRPDDAAKYVERAFAEFPGHARARVVAAALLADRGRADAAVAELEKVLALPSPPPEAHLRLGQVLAARPDSAERAQAEIEAFLTLARDGDPLRAEARAALDAVVSRRAAARARELTAELVAARDRDDAPGVVAAGEALLALSAADAKALLALGTAYADLDRPHDAFLTWRRILDRPAYDREWPKAAAATRRLEQRYLPSPADRDALEEARAMLGEGRLGEAREAFAVILRRAPFLEDALAGAAEAWLERRDSGSYGVRDDPQRALRLTDVLVARNANHLRGNELRAEALLRTGSFRDALDLAVACLRQDPLRHDPATTAGFAALALGDPSGALAHLKTSLERRRTARALYGRAVAWEAIGHRGAARDEATMLVEEFGVPPAMEAEVRALAERLGLEITEGPK